MKPWLILILLAGLFIPVAGADLEWFGYVESQVTGNDWKDDLLLMQTNKLRLDLKSKVSSRVTVAANVNFITFHGRTEWPVLDFFPEAVADTVPDALVPAYTLSFRDRIFLDNAWMRIALGNVDLTVGRQQISPGTGYVWNPVDLFNIKDVLDPTYEQPGHNALRADLSLGGKVTLTGLFAVGDQWESSARMLQLKSRLGRFDVAVMTAAVEWGFTEFSPDALGETGFPSLRETRRMLGVCVAGQVLGVGVWGEAAFNRMDNFGDFSEFVLGGDYTFDFQTYVMAEYFHSELGRRDVSEYGLSDWMRLLAQEQKTLARDQLFFILRHPVTDFIDVSMRGIWCITDGSVALVPTLNWSLAGNLDLSLYINLNLGGEGTYYSSSSGSGGMVRLRAYF